MHIIYLQYSPVFVGGVVRGGAYPRLLGRRPTPIRSIGTLTRRRGSSTAFLCLLLLGSMVLIDRRSSGVLDPGKLRFLLVSMTSFSSRTNWSCRRSLALTAPEVFCSVWPRWTLRPSTTDDSTYSGLPWGTWRLSALQWNKVSVSRPESSTHPQPSILNLIRFQSHGGTDRWTRCSSWNFSRSLPLLVPAVVFPGFYRLSPGISTPIGGRDCSDIICAGFPLWLALKQTLPSPLILITITN